MPEPYLLPGLASRAVKVRVCSNSMHLHFVCRTSCKHEKEKMVCRTWTLDADARTRGAVSDEASCPDT